MANKKKRAPAATRKPATGSRKPQATTKPAPPVGLIIGVCLLALVVVVLLIVFVLGGDDDEPLVAAGSENSTTEGGGVQVSDPSGVPEVTLYVDYSCPGCAAFEPVGGAALLDAADRDEIALRVVTMSFLGEAPDGDSALAANAAQCADDQGAFVPYHEALFAWTDQQLADGDSPGRSTDQLIALGDDAGVPDTDEFAACVGDATYMDYVEDMQTQSHRDGVGGTPGVYLDGEELSSDQLGELATDPEALQRLLTAN